MTMTKETDSCKGVLPQDSSHESQLQDDAEEGAIEAMGLAVQVYAQSQLKKLTILHRVNGDMKRYNDVIQSSIDLSHRCISDLKRSNDLIQSSIELSRDIVSQLEIVVPREGLATQVTEEPVDLSTAPVE
jgi:hypothetical protein